MMVPLTRGTPSIRRLVLTCLVLGIAFGALALLSNLRGH